MKAVRSISIGCSLRSYNAITKWKKFDFRRLLGGCFSKWARPMPRLMRHKYVRQGDERKEKAEETRC